MLGKDVVDKDLVRRRLREETAFVVVESEERYRADLFKLQKQKLPTAAGRRGGDW